MQAEAQQQEIEETTSVELEDTSTEEVVENSKEVELQENEQTQTNDQDDDELDQYSENVQKRIKKLTAARRKAEEEAAAAVQYIQRVQSENEDIKQRLKTIDKGYVSEYEGRITSQEAQAKRALAEAHEAGDYEKVADAQSAIAQIAIEKERLRLQKARSEQDAQQAEVPQQAQPQAQPQPQQERDPKLEAWLSKNTWFGKDSIMTGAARALHETLVAEDCASSVSSTGGAFKVPSSPVTETTLDVDSSVVSTSSSTIAVATAATDCAVTFVPKDRGNVAPNFMDYLSSCLTCLCSF